MVAPVEQVETANQPSNIRTCAKGGTIHLAIGSFRSSSPHRIGNSASRRWLTHSKFSRGVLRPGGGSVAGSNSAFSR